MRALWRRSTPIHRATRFREITSTIESILAAAKDDETIEISFIDGNVVPTKVSSARRKADAKKAKQAEQKANGAADPSFDQDVQVSEDGQLPV